MSANNVIIATAPVHRLECVVRLPIKSDSQACGNWGISHTAASVGHFAPKTNVCGQNKNENSCSRTTSVSVH